MAQICKHDRLARACEVCDMESEIAELKAENDRMRNGLIAILTRTNGTSPYTTAGSVNVLARNTLYPKEVTSDGAANR